MFWAATLKNYCQIWSQGIRIRVIGKFGVKIKSLNLGPKIPDFGILGLEFEKNIAIFETSALEFV